MANELAQLGAASWLRWIAGLLLVAMGLYLADWWRGLTHLETAGRYLWAYIQPLGKRLMPVDSVPKATLLGLVWGWLPCGLVYSALAYAMAQGQAAHSGLVMLAFGAGTLPSVLATGLVAQQLGRWLRKPQVRWPLAVAIILFGCWTIWGGGHTGHDHNHHNATEMHDHQQMDHNQMNHDNKSEVDHSNMDHSSMDHSHSHHGQIAPPPAETNGTAASSAASHGQHLH